MTAIESIKQDLAGYGFLLCDLKSVSYLPESVWLEPKSGTESGLTARRFNTGSLLLVGHAGKKFWQSFSQYQADVAIQKPDPVDSYSAEITQQTIEKHLINVAAKCLFPAVSCPVNLMELGKAFAWHSPSPLGMGIHKKYGLWSAYRAVWWLDMEMSDAKSDDSTPYSSRKVIDVCIQCQTHECVSACPAAAVNYGSNPDLGRCADYRLMESSECESTCLSRMACPYAAEHRYTEPQMNYHYELARSAIAQYRKQSS